MELQWTTAIFETNNEKLNLKRYINGLAISLDKQHFNYCALERAEVRVRRHVLWFFFLLFCMMEKMDNAGQTKCGITKSTNAYWRQQVHSPQSKWTLCALGGCCCGCCCCFCVVLFALLFFWYQEKIEDFFSSGRIDTKKTNKDKQSTRSMFIYFFHRFLLLFVCVINRC